MKKIDTGNSSFEKLVTSGNMYVDKTRFVYELLTDGGTYYFLSRPRRFGKTLAVNTFEAVFNARRELFRGLYIDSVGYEWPKHPVLHFDFSKAETKSADEFSNWLKWEMARIGEKYGFAIDREMGVKSNLDALISTAANREGMKAVVLVDEYDKPLSDNIRNSNVEEIREVVREFFEVIKAACNDLRFVFITGVTRYAKVSIFSSMNNLNDISMDRRYAAMFGYAQSELETEFDEHIRLGVAATGMTRSAYMGKLKGMYDGYRFSDAPETVYNPVSVGSFFSKGGSDFVTYWTDTGGNAQLIVDMARHVNFDISKDLAEPVTRQIVSGYDIIDMTRDGADVRLLKSLLYQSGYLTISKVMPGGHSYVLDFPNAEVREGFAARLLAVYAGDEAQRSFSSKLRNISEWKDAVL